MSKPEELQKYKELYDLAKYAFQEETARITRIDEKASRYFTVISIFLGVLGIVSTSYLSLYFPPTTIIDYLGIITFGMVAVFLAISWFQTFRVLKVREVKSIPMNEEMIDYFNKRDIIDVYKDISEKNFKEAIEASKDVSKTKSPLLESSYLFLMLSFFSIILVIGLVGWKFYYMDSIINKTEEINMQNTEVIESVRNNLPMILEEKPKPSENPGTPTPQPPPNSPIHEGDKDRGKRKN